MRTLNLAIVAFLAAAAAPALAQTPAAADAATGARPGHEIGTGSSLPRSDRASNVTPADTSSAIAPTLPSPPLGDDATPRDYLTSARASLAAGRIGQAQQALEMAETRALDRSVLQSQSDYLSRSRFAFQIAEARRALGNGNRDQAIPFIDGASTQ